MLDDELSFAEERARIWTGTRRYVDWRSGGIIHCYRVANEYRESMLAGVNGKSERRLMTGLVRYKSRFGSQQREFPFLDDEEMASTSEGKSVFGDHRARQRENAGLRTSGYRTLRRSWQ